MIEQLQNPLFGNTGALGIVLVGCFDEEECGNNYTEPTSNQVNALDGLVGLLNNSLPNLGCMAEHDRFPGQQTACPGDSCRIIVSQIASN